MYLVAGSMYSLQIPPSIIRMVLVHMMNVDFIGYFQSEIAHRTFGTLGLYKILAFTVISLIHPVDPISNF